MARSYGQIVAAIWRDDDFRALPVNAQWAYLMLATQGNISSCGLLPLTLGRWSNYAPDLDRDSLSIAFTTLTDRLFVVIDWATEELLVRSFAKWDGGSTNSKRRPAITAAANAVVSPEIRAALAVELDKLGVPHGITDSPSIAYRIPIDTPRVVVTEGEYEPEPRTTTLNPETGTLAHPDAPTAQTIIAEWIERCNSRPPGRTIGQVAKLTGEMLGEGIDPDDVRRGLAAWMSKGLHPSTLPSVVNEVMNAPPSRASTADSRAHDALALAARLRDQETA